jgi:cob(I)alamin adenosyltransferase
MIPKDRAPREHRLRARYRKKGLILVFTGNGKGKTTAALGTALRTIGHDRKVAMVQFLKGSWKTGEVKTLLKQIPEFSIFSEGNGFTWETKNFERDRQTAERAWGKCLELLQSNEYALVILDEINYVLQYGFLEPKAVVRALQARPPLKHVILTGDGAPPEIIKAADLVTEMKAVKHPYEAGILAQPGIEY